MIRWPDLQSFHGRAATIAAAVIAYPALLAWFFWSGRIAPRRTPTFFGNLQTMTGA